jgi:polyferredoxin
MVAFDHQRAQECHECLACVKACPVGVDIRKGPHMACIHCAECVDACTERMARRDSQSLVRYYFGIPGERRTGTRVIPLLTGVLTAISLAFFMYLSLTRMPFDMNVRWDYNGVAEVRADGAMTNAYVLSLRNMGNMDLVLDLSASSSPVQNSAIRVSPDIVKLKKGTDIMKIPVIVTIERKDGAEKHPLTITLTLRSKLLGESISKPAVFMVTGNNR